MEQPRTGLYTKRVGRRQRPPIAKSAHSSGQVVLLVREVLILAFAFFLNGSRCCAVGRPASLFGVQLEVALQVGRDGERPEADGACMRCAGESRDATGSATERKKRHSPPPTVCNTRRNG